MNLQEELSLPFPLRPYQEEGVEFLTKNNSALLGDDMGLGKTVQTIVALKQHYLKNGIRPTLIIVPNAVVTNWLNEFHIWFPEVRVSKVQGNKDQRDFQFVMNDGYLICTYEQARIQFMKMKTPKNYNLLIFDEAHRLKNSESNIHLAASFVKKDLCWMLTGTPLENKKEDILSLLSIMDINQFNQEISNSEVSSITSKHMLRRLKKQVLDELPDLIEQEILIDMTQKQKQEYQVTYDKSLNIDRNDTGSILGLITELKKICNLAPDSRESGKVEYLKEILSEINSKDEKVIIFSQYVQTLKYLSEVLDFKSEIYHGSLSNDEKQNAVDNFKNSEGFNILYMSLKAGGVGLNLQEASSVILFDRWWNPATEKQAIARAHRMGNSNTVHAIKLRTPNTIEDRIIELLHEKEDLFDEIIEGAVSKREKSKLLKILNIQNEDE